MKRMRVAIFSLSAAVMLASQPASAAASTRSQDALPAAGLNSAHFVSGANAGCNATASCSQWAAKGKKKKKGGDVFGGQTSGGHFPFYFLLGPIALAGLIAAAAGGKGNASPG